MKYLAFLIISLLTQYSLNAQEVDGKSDVDKTNQVYTFVEQMPEYPSGEDMMKIFFSNHKKFPENAKKNNIQGTVFVTFVVEKDGTLSDIKVLRGVQEDIDKEAIRVISTMPKWTPGKQRGIPVRVQYNLPVKFTLKEIEN
jgi:protein TonB